MKDYYATLRIQQGRLKAAMQGLGIESAREMQRRAGVSYQAVGNLLNFRQSPRKKNGEWRPVTLAICRVLGSEPLDLFPEHLDHEIPTNRIASFVEHAQLAGRQTLQLDPAEEYQQAETKQTLDEVLGTLTARERSVLAARFWDGTTQAEIAEEMGLTAQCISKIEQKALRRLRHPSRIDKLQGLCAYT